MSLNAKRPDDVYAALFTFMDPSSSPATVQLILSDKTAFHLFSPACLSPSSYKVEFDMPGKVFSSPRSYKDKRPYISYYISDISRESIID